MFFDEVGADDGGGSGDTGIALNKYIFPLISMFFNEVVGGVKMHMDGIVLMILHLHDFDVDFGRNSVNGAI